MLKSWSLMVIFSIVILRQFPEIIVIRDVISEWARFADAWNSLQFIKGYFAGLFLKNIFLYNGYLYNGFFSRNGSKDVVSGKDVLLGVRKIKNNI